MTGARPRDVVVVGGSAGALNAFITLISGLPGGFGAALLVAFHIGRRPSLLAEVLARSGPLPVAWAKDGEPIRRGRILVAPPDYHLLLEAGRVKLSRGPRENNTRPAVDPLFRSAAFAYGPRVIGLILSGALSDGTAGFAEIKRCGGLTLVQEPQEAKFPSMPLSALRYTRVDHRVPVAEMADLIVGLSGAEPRDEAAEWPEVPKPDRGGEGGMTGGYDLKQPVALTCPACGGALADTTEDTLPYFTCHIGHRFAAADMDEAQFRQVENALEVALRTLNERSAFSRRFAEAARARGSPRSASRWDAAAEEAEERAEVLRQFVEKGWQRPDLGE